MFEKLFGNSVIEKILFYLQANTKGYASEITSALGLSLYSVQLALTRLEIAGILIRQPQGKTQVYQYNPRYPFLVELKALIQKAYDSLPEGIKMRLYEPLIRRRPRRKGKPL
jgi:DNA-binding transcriptional ArsR family regulator